MRERPRNATGKAVANVQGRDPCIDRSRTRNGPRRRRRPPTVLSRGYLVKTDRSALHPPGLERAVRRRAADYEEGVVGQAFGRIDPAYGRRRSPRPERGWRRSIPLCVDFRRSSACNERPLRVDCYRSANGPRAPPRRGWSTPEKTIHFGGQVRVGHLRRRRIVRHHHSGRRVEPDRVACSLGHYPARRAASERAVRP